MTSWQRPNNSGSVPDLLEVEVSRGEDEVELMLIGELDIGTSPRLRGALEELEHAPPSRLVVNLSRLSFLDSTGLALLVSLDKRCQEKRGPFLELRPGPPAVQRLFELAGVADRLPFSPTAAARAAVQS